jgi:hypothetical protein
MKKGVYVYIFQREEDRGHLPIRRLMPKRGGGEGRGAKHPAGKRPSTPSEKRRGGIFKVIRLLGVWRGESKGVEDSRKPPALHAGHPQNSCKAVSGVARPQDVER